MGKIFDFNGKRNGSYIDPVSGVVGVNSNGKWVRSEKGFAWKSTIGTEDLGYAFPFDLNQDWSISLEFIIKTLIDGPSWENLFSFDLGWSTGLQVFVNRTLWQYTDATSGTLTYTNAVEYHKWQHIIITNDNTSKVMTCYLDGVENGSLTYTKTLRSTPASINLGEIGSRDFAGEKSKASLYDHLLTEKERVKLYQEFLQATPTTKIIQ